MTNVKKLLTTLSLAMGLVVAAAVSAFCASAGGEGPRSLSGVHLSFAKPSVIVLAQAGSDSGDKIHNPQSGGSRTVSNGLFAPGNGAEDAQAHEGDSNSNDKGNGNGHGRCKNGRYVGNPHCVTSPCE